MAKVVFNIHNILSYTFTVQYKPVYILLLCTLYVHVSELACNAARLIMLCQLYFDITPY